MYHPNQRLASRRRAVVQTACQQCRKGRTKCDGEEPCSRCVEHSLQCSYNRMKAVSKGSLRDQVERLERLNLLSDALLDAIATDDGNSGVTDHIIHSLRSGVDRGDIAKSVHLMKANNAQGSAGGSLSSEKDAMDRESTPASGQYSVRPSTPSVMNNDSCSPPTTWNTPSSTRSSPAEPPDPPVPRAPRAATWTTPGLPKPHVRELLELVLESDGMLFCLLRKDLFLRDFDNGGTRYCSAALVHALLALVAENKPEGLGVNQSLQVYLQQLNRRSEEIFNETVTVIANVGERPKSLPDAQALGVLALHEVTSSYEGKPRILADEFAMTMTELYHHKRSSQLEDDVYMRVLTSTYHGSISFLRTLCLSRPSKYQYLDILDSRPGASSSQEKIFTALGARYFSADIPVAGVGTQENATTDSQGMAARIFQVVEWTYLLRTQPDTPFFSMTASMYIRCLEWYNDLFQGGISDRDSHLTPFVHMLYQFCFFKMLSPYVNMPNADYGSIQPSETCHQAAQNILRLAVAQYLGRGPRASPGFTLRLTSKAMTYLSSNDRTGEEASEFAELITKIQELGFQFNDMELTWQSQLQVLAPLPVELTLASLHNGSIPFSVVPRPTTMGPSADNFFEY